MRGPDRARTRSFGATVLLAPLLVGACSGGVTGGDGEPTPDAAGAGTPSASVPDSATASPTSESEAGPPPDDAATTQPAAEATTEEPPRGEVTLAVVGDVMLDRRIADLTLGSGADQPLAGVRDLLRGADLTVGTLETPIGTTGTPEPKSHAFQAPPESVDVLLDGGFDVVTLANNHILDQGPDGMTETGALLDEAGIAHVGAGADSNAAREPHVVEVEGVSIGFLAYADVLDETNGYPMTPWEAQADSPGLAWGHPDQVAEDVAALAPDVDHVIVLMHSGLEGSSVPVPAQEGIVEAAREAGASMVLGSHPHVLQPIETDDDFLVAWSLGNFVFDGFEGWYDGAAVQSTVLSITLDADDIVATDTTPVRLVDGLPVPVEDADEVAAILGRLYQGGAPAS